MLSLRSYSGSDIRRNPIVLIMLGSVYLFAFRLGARDQRMLKVAHQNHCIRVWRSEQVALSLRWLQGRNDHNEGLKSDCKNAPGMPDHSEHAFSPVQRAMQIE
jgi:hypothetical protein